MTPTRSTSPRSPRSARSAGFSSRSGGRRGPRAAWKLPDEKNTRTGHGVKYGNLELTPKDHYAIHPADARGDVLRVIVMGGNEEVGKNMTILEYGDDIILIDMGIQFGEEHMRGIDGIVPDLSYIKGREKNVRAVIITHMHMDHIGGIPYLMPLLPGVPVFSAPITLALVAKKLEYTPEIKVDLRPIDEATTLQLGNFKVSFIGVSHSVPSALAVIVESPCGKIVHTGDFKVDLDPKDNDGKRYLEQMKALGDQNVVALLSDSTNAGQSGNQLMERDVMNDLDAIVAQAKGRLLFGMISSNVVRLAQIITLAEKYGRYVAIGGLSLKTTLEIAQNLGYINPTPGTLLDISEVRNFPPNKVLAIFPGAQGETNAAFYRLADNDLRDVRVMPGDSVIFSSSVIPGNERTVQFITDKFYRLGAKVVNYRMLNIHAGGHAKAADLAEVVKMVKPKYLIPIEGHHAFLHYHAAAAIAGGFPRQNILIADNGQVMEFTKDGTGTLTKNKVSVDPIFVDGGQLGVIDADTLRERKRLGDEGVMVIDAVVKDGIVAAVNIASLGFRKESFLPQVEQTITNFLKREYPKVAAQRDPQALLQDRLEEMVKNEMKSTPYIALSIMR
ncbi:MAG: RNase J family beta-CASP ribonuclease [Patescibacteria group bacterium]